MDIDQSQVVPDEIDQSAVIPDGPKKPGPLSEIGTAFKRGALVGLPTLAGQALQFTSEPGGAVYGLGSSLVNNAKARGEQESYQLHPEAHNAITNALASGAEMAPQVLGPALIAGGAIAASPLELPALAGLGLTSAAMATPFAMQAGQTTLDKAKEKGVPEADARAAARLNAAQTFGTQTALGMVGGKLLGAAGSALGKIVGEDGASLASSTLDMLTGANGIIKPLAKQTGVAAVEGVGLGAAQAAASAKIENAYGIDDTSPFQAAKDSIIPMLGLTAVMTPLGLAGRALGVRAAKGRTDALASPDTHPEARSQLAEQYASALDQVNPEAATNFRANAKTAIEGKEALPVDSGLFTKDAIRPEVPPEEPLQIENNPSPMIVFPDGTASRNWHDAENYLNGLPEDQRTDARAKLFGFGPDKATAGPQVDIAQDAVKAELSKAGITPAEPMSFADVASALKEEAKKQGQTLTQGDIADIYQAHQQDVEQANVSRLMKEREPKEAAAEAPEGQPKPEIPAEPARLNSQIPDALERAQDEKATRDQATQVDAAYQQVEASKDRDLTAIQNITKGGELASAAAAGKDVQNTVTLPLPHTEFLSKLAEAKDDDQAMPPKLKQEVTQAVKGKTSLDDQVKAIGELRDGKKETTASFELLDKLHNRLLEERPAEVAQEGKAPAESPVEAQVPRAERTVTEKAQAAADKLDATLAGFNDRARAGEQFTPLEQERFEDATNFRRVLSETLGNMTPEKEAYVKDLTEFAQQTEQPYEKSFNAEYRGPTNPNERSIDMVRQLIQPGANADSILAHLSENATTPWVKTLADKLRAIGLQTKMGLSFDKNMAGDGQYNGIKDTIDIAQGGENEHVVLHELTHAATVTRIIRASEIDTPRNQAEAQLKKAYTDIDGIRQEALKRASADDHYGLTDNKEFIAELNTNPDFQKFLDHKNLWQRAVDAVRRLLGMDASSKTALDKAMSAQGAFFSSENYKSYLADKAARADPEARTREFNASYKGASDIVDDSFSSLARAADKIGDGLNLKSIDRAAFKSLMGWKTVQYIADRVRAIPEMVAAGMATGADGLPRGADAYQAANGIRKLATSHIEDPAAKFARGAELMMYGMKDDDAARALSKQMMRLGGEGSLLGFDVSKNFNDNLKDRPDLSPANKQYIDDLHREFASMERTNPAAAKAITDGAKLNRKMYVSRAATIVANLMDASVGTMRRLEAELQRMDPADAARTKLVDALKGATADGQFSATHAQGLDFMGKDLATQRNGNPSQHIDGESFVLDSRIRNALAEAEKLPEGSQLRSQLLELSSLYRNQVDNPYYSLGRDGDYFVKVGFKGMDAPTWAKVQDALKGTNKILGGLGEQDHAFFRVDTLDQAQGMLRKLQEAGGDKIVDTARGKVSEAGELNNSAGLNSALRSVLTSLHDSVDVNGVDPAHAAAMKDAMTRQFLSMLPETSAKKSLMRRQGVPGYDGDFLQNFTKRASGAVQDTANIYSARNFAQSFKGMKDAVETLNRTGDADTAARAQMVHDELALRYSNSMNPVTSDAVNMINSLGHSFYLALSPGFFIRTMAQPWHRAMPIFGARFGYVNGSKELAGATGTAMKVIAATIKQGWNEGGARGILDAEMNFKDMGLNVKDEAFVQEMHDRGVLNLGQSRQLMRMAMGGNPKMADLARFASMTAQYAEMTNRLVTGLAAFRLAEKNSKGDSTAKNTEYAIQTIERSMDNFDQSNTARQISKQGFAGKVTPLMTAFMNYNLQTMQQIARTVHDGVFNTDKSPEGLQRSAEAKKEFAGLMGTTALISGAMGLPFVNAFAGIYNTLTKDDDDPHDIKIDVQNFLSDIAGQHFGEILSHGIGRTIGVDTSTFGLQNLLPGSEFLDNRRLLKDRFDEQSKQLLGPALNAVLDISLAASKISDGYYVKGIEQALPSGLKAYYKAAEIATNGYTDSKGNPIGLEATPWDIAVQATGLQPADKATRSEASQDFYTNQQLLNHRKGVITDQIYKAATAGDAEGQQDAFQALRDFNAKNPLQPITDIAGTFRQHAIELAMAKASGTGIGTGARKVPILKEQERFAAMPKP